MSWAADGQDGNGCILKKLGMIALCLGKFAYTRIIVYSLFENSLDIFLLVFYKHFVYDIESFNLGRI